jgi:hypothetical protein
MIDRRRQEMAAHNDSVANTNLCAAEQCTRPVRKAKTKGGQDTNASRYCNMHYIRWTRHGRLTDRWGDH